MIISVPEGEGDCMRLRDSTAAEGQSQNEIFSLVGLAARSHPQLELRTSGFGLHFQCRSTQSLQMDDAITVVAVYSERRNKQK